MSDTVLRTIEGIAFDLEDTLFNKADWLIPALEYAAPKIGLDPMMVNQLAIQYTMKTGAVDAGIFNFILTSSGQSDSALNIRALLAACQEYVPKPGSIQFYPGVTNALGTLTAHYKIAVMADGPVNTQRAIVSGLGLDRFISRFVYSDSIDGSRSRRPDARPYREVLELLDTRATKTLFVADNPYKDFKTARYLGFVTVRVMTGEYANMLYPSDEHRADYEVSSASQLPALLEKAPLPVRKLDIDFLSTDMIELTN